MSYRRERRPIDIVEWEVMNLVTGNTVAHLDDIEDVRTTAFDYRQNPDLIFIGIDKLGRQVQTWTMDDALNGRMDRDLV